MLCINGLPMYSEIKHIYCNTEIRPTRKEFVVERRSKEWRSLILTWLPLATSFKRLKNECHYNHPHPYLSMLKMWSSTCRDRLFGMPIFAHFLAHISYIAKVNNLSPRNLQGYWTEVNQILHNVAKLLHVIFLKQLNDWPIYCRALEQRANIVNFVVCKRHQQEALLLQSNVQRACQ